LFRLQFTLLLVHHPTDLRQEADDFVGRILQVFFVVVEEEVVQIVERCNFSALSHRFDALPHQEGERAGC
jgi:hypothetical protein